MGAPQLKDYQRVEGARAALTEAYRAVLAEFYRCDSECLRLLPVSSGGGAGKYSDEQMRFLTAEALQAALSQLPADRGKQIEMCIFDQEEWKGYKQAFQSSFGP